MRRPPTVARVLERVTATAREHEMFLPGHTVLVCVSGGRDSVCLLESLVRLRRLFRVRLEVFHLAQLIAEGVDATREHLDAVDPNALVANSPFGPDGTAAT